MIKNEKKTETADEFFERNWWIGLIVMGIIVLLFVVIHNSSTPVKSLTIKERIEYSIRQENREWTNKVCPNYPNC